MEENSPRNVKETNIDFPFLIHATSVSAAQAILADGNLRSPFSMLSDTDIPQAHLMGGGKKGYVRANTRQYVINQLKDQTVRPMDVCKYITDPLELQTIEGTLHDYELEGTYKWGEIADYLEEILSKACLELHKQGFYGNKVPAYVAPFPYLYVFNTLPQETRRQIALSSGAEHYVSTTLGYALDKYTPVDRRRQAAVVLPLHSLPVETLYMNGGTNFMRPYTQDLLNQKIKGIKVLQKKATPILHEELYGGGVPDIAVMNNVINLREVGGLVVLPDSANVPETSGIPIQHFDIHTQKLTQAIAPIFTL